MRKRVQPRVILGFLLLVLCFAYLFIGQVSAVWPFTIDDMYIPLRYATHWYNGYGLSWNIAEPPVEGYSNFSFVLLARLALQWGFNPVLVLKGAGVIGLFATLVAIYKLTRFWLPPRFAFLPCLLALVYPGQIIWSVGGLETTVYQALICWAILLLLRGQGYTFHPCQPKNPSPLPFALAGLLFSIAGLTRPEAPVFMMMSLLLLGLDRPRPMSPNYLRGLFLFTGVIALAYLPYFFWRWHYFGYLFPNPVYCKGLSGVYPSLDIGYLQLAWPFACLAAIAIFRYKDRRFQFLWLPSLIYLILLFGSEPLSSFANRLFLLPFCLLLPLSILGLLIIIQRYYKDDDVINVAMYFAAFLVAFFFAQSISLTNYRQTAQNTLNDEHLRRALALWLKNHSSPTNKIMLSDVGLVPYLDSNPFIDSYCLNNVAMRKFPKKTMYLDFCESILSTKPEIIVLTSLLEGQDLLFSPPADACLSKKLATTGQYKLVKTMTSEIKVKQTSKRFYRYQIYVRR
ncbi:hypothetical protein [Legionella massiliensis]|nr:hypothetical protein [Legionella massiliensis]